ncbi:transmembrane protein, putative (macronuclear) [Tetrahymena thermophila SB210]|uniref:Transmembrane protein, putative n=1 Tax=Tetrahymena thermophila (strain SB210) TaxID=312017 RepID=A4VF66_TETTS|nr:transmembrane protein, putative [Tetrahymena thermophila SB210]EDK31200.1 transmembrane protein, putative [Tetrahymena thermophila SB210]|eukprot:XP_001470608.1 transmembrane protein, putative [Tetrahymena thermophila SB210]
MILKIIDTQKHLNQTNIMKQINTSKQYNYLKVINQFIINTLTIFLKKRTLKFIYKFQYNFIYHLLTIFTFYIFSGTCLIKFFGFNLDSFIYLNKKCEILLVAKKIHSFIILYNLQIYFFCCLLALFERDKIKFYFLSILKSIINHSKYNYLFFYLFQFYLICISKFKEFFSIL